MIAVPLALLGRTFTLDGNPVDVADFIRTNVEAECFDQGDVDEIYALRVEQSIGYGGGAQALSILKRTS